MVNVVLIHAPINFDVVSPTGDQTSSPPIGILYIAAYLEKFGISVAVYDPVPEKLSLEEILKKLAKDKPRVVGISAVTFGTRAAVEIARAIREKFGKEIVIGLGGMHISTDPTFIKRFPYFDFGVIGEGEKEMYKLASKILRGDKVSGIYEAEIIENLDEIPFPARHLIKRENYYLPHQGENSKLPATMISSRGCPYNCTFCSKPINRARYRVRSGKDIVDEMEAIYENCNGHYSFVCDTMTLFKDKTLEMCQEIKKRGLKVKWMANTRVDRVDEELIRNMAEAGCTDLFFGVESGNSRIRNEVAKKMISDEQIVNTIKWCWKYGIQSSIYMMLGFPTETKKEIEDTINFPILIGADFIGVHITWPQPGSTLFEQSIKEGIIPKTVIDDFVKGKFGDDLASFWPVYIPKGLSYQDLVRAKKKAYRKFYLRPSWLFKRLRWYLRTPEKLFSDLREIKVGTKALLYGSTGVAET
ncbi:MAG: B12-binding domain-containing radical SAM protein [Deltaproteobacteria bacterium]|nr:B12-binding domain-containing radical SAM protein [Deltaproteobacteria bacterium]